MPRLRSAGFESGHPLSESRLADPLGEPGPAPSARELDRTFGAWLSPVERCVPARSNNRFFRGPALTAPAGRGPVLPLKTFRGCLSSRRKSMSRRGFDEGKSEAESAVLLQ